MQCSELFEEIFDSGISGCRRDCACGRTYFDGNPQSGWGWEDGELERLRRQMAEHPDLYVETDCSVGTMIVNGYEVVYGCECNVAKKYETFLVNQAERIAKYLNQRAKLLRQKADAIEVIA